MSRAIIHIEKSFYYSAGMKYGWNKGGYDIRGVGVNVQLLQNYDEIELIIDGNEYVVNCDEVIAFIRKFNSIEDHKGVDIGIVSKSLLKQINIPKKVEIKKGENNTRQIGLF